MKNKITLFFGGTSSEHDISCQSAQSIVQSALKQHIDLQVIGISKQGQWYYLPSIDHPFIDDQWMEDPKYPVVLDMDPLDPSLLTDIDGQTIRLPLHKALIIMHGINGEDGRLQGLLEMCNVKIIGCGSLSSGLCMDKYRSHQLVRSYGITTADTRLIHTNKDYDLTKMIDGLSYPLFIKPNRAGSSFGISKVFNQDELINAIDQAKAYDDDVIIESCIDGVEVGTGILQCRYGTIIGSVDMIKIHGDYYDYNEKYHGTTSQIINPAPLGDALVETIKSIALKIFEILDCKGFARIDLFLTKDNQIVFNEVNTIPGMTDHSRFPNMMANKGISFDGLVALLCDERMV